MEASSRAPAKWRQHLTLALPPARPGCIWVHACSVGEVGSVAPLIKALQAGGFRIHLSVVTATGFAHAKRLLGEDFSVSFLPWDVPGCMSRLSGRLRPALLLLVETEFWPGLLRACRKQSVPVISINTRISNSSFPRYFATRFLWRRWLAHVSLFLTQSRLDADRLQAMGVGAEKIQSVGNLKYAIAAPKVDAGQLRQRLDAGCNRPILLVASTHQGEDARILDMWPAWHACNRDLLTVIVPRHPERFDAVAELISGRGHKLARWSEGDRNHADFVLIDVMGILTELYTIADIVILGGSIANTGGHNPLEAAICGRGVVTGPHIQNFKSIMDDLKQCNAVIMAHNDRELEAVVSRLLNRPEELTQLHAQAALFIEDKSHVLDRMIKAIRPWLPNV
jgi:3-deoxy-D-manno-octulosonic-acid transferase